MSDMSSVVYQWMLSTFGFIVQRCTHRMENPSYTRGGENPFAVMLKTLSGMYYGSNY